MLCPDCRIACTYSCFRNNYTMLHTALIHPIFARYSSRVRKHCFVLGTLAPIHTFIQEAKTLEKKHLHLLTLNQFLSWEDTDSFSEKKWKCWQQCVSEAYKHVEQEAAACWYRKCDKNLNRKSSQWISEKKFLLWDHFPFLSSLACDLQLSHTRHYNFYCVNYSVGFYFSLFLHQYYHIVLFCIKNVNIWNNFTWNHVTLYEITSYETTVSTMAYFSESTRIFKHKFYLKFVPYPSKVQTCKWEMAKNQFFGRIKNPNTNKQKNPQSPLRILKTLTSLNSLFFLPFFLLFLFYL